MAQRTDEFRNVATAADDVCLLAFTSGTTGNPKATMHFHRDVLVMRDVVGRHLLETAPDDIYTGSPPLGFTFGLGALLVFPLGGRGAVALVEQPTPDNLLDAIARFRATALFTAPTAYRALVPLVAGRDISSLRRCISAGEALPKATSDAWHAATGMRIIDGIGATEMIHIFISAKGDEIRPGATGKPLPGYQACVLDDQGRPLPRPNAGRLAVKGPSGCRYLDDPRQLEYVQNGWNVTGDRYYVDAGRLLLVPGARRRHDHLGRLQHRRPGSRGRVAAASGRAGMCGGRRARRAARPDRQGIRRDQRRSRRRRSARARAAGARQARDCSVQVSTRRGIRTRVAKNAHGQAAALRIARTR